MKIVFLDSKTIGDDIDLSEYDKLGEVVKYDFSTTEEAAQRTRDADVIVVNKVEVNEKSIGQAKKFKARMCDRNRHQQSGQRISAKERH